MRKLCLVLALVAVLTATASAGVTVTLVGPPGPVAPDSFFDVFVEVTSDVNLAMVQVVLDMDPSVVLDSVASPLASLAFINPPDTAVADYFPNTHSGSFTGMTLTMKAPSVDGTYAIDLVLVDGSSMSTAVFDAGYTPMWALTPDGTSVTVSSIPEPFTVSLLALVGLGGVIASRKK